MGAKDNKEKGAVEKTVHNPPTRRHGGHVALGTLEKRMRVEGIETDGNPWGKLLGKKGLLKKKSSCLMYGGNKRKDAPYWGEAR